MEQRSAGSIRGEYNLLVKQTGAIEVTYSYTLVNATGEMLEAGFALAVPASQSQFRWLGQGPYAGYPGKDRLNEYGFFRLNREDLCFPGNRRGGASRRLSRILPAWAFSSPGAA